MRYVVFYGLVIYAFTSLVLAGQGFSSDAERPKVPVASDLHDLALKSNQENIPILIMYSSDTCEYCERLEDDLLAPMYLDSKNQKRVIIRKVMIDSIDEIKDFSGKEVDAEEFAYNQGVQVTPTLRFVDAKGDKLVPDMIGYNTPEMYGAYVDNAIESSLKSLSKAQ